MDARTTVPVESDPRIAYVGSLNASQLKVAECLSRNLDDEGIAQEMRLRRSQVAGLVDDVYRTLRFDSKIAMFERRGYVGELYLAYMAQQGLDSPPIQNSGPADSAVFDAARERILACGLDIDAFVQKLGNLSDMQRIVVSHLVLGHDDRTIAEATNHSKRAIESMHKVIRTELGVPENLDSLKGREFVAAIGRWVAGTFDESARIFESISRKEDGSPQDLLPEEEMGRVVDRLAQAREKLRKVAQCIAEGSDIKSTFDISDSNVHQHVSMLFRTLQLPRSMGSELRRQIVAEAYRQLLKRPVSAPIEEPSGGRTDNRDLLPVVAGVVVTVPDIGSVVDITDDLIKPDEDAVPCIQGRHEQGYELACYVIRPGSNDRYLIFVKRRCP